MVSGPKESEGEGEKRESEKRHTAYTRERQHKWLRIYHQTLTEAKLQWTNTAKTIKGKEHFK